MKIHKVTCIYCKQVFDRDKEEFIKVGTRRYAHKVCPNSVNILQEELEKIALQNYIKKLFNIPSLDYKIGMQIKRLHEEEHYSYKSIQLALEYFYDVKHNSIEGANGGIGIVPWVINEARDYYHDLFLAQERNKNMKIQSQEIINFSIPTPVRKEKKRKLFTFLDEEPDNKNGE